MKRKTNNKTAKQKEYKSTSARIKALQAERKKIIKEFEDCVDAVGNNHANYLAWLHYGNLIYRELAADRDLKLRYVGVKHAIEETLSRNGKLALDHLKRYLERKVEIDNLVGPGVPDPVA